MINKIKLTLLALALLVVPVFATTAVSAEPADINISDCVSDGVNLDGAIDGDCTPATDVDANADLTSIIKTVINIISIVVGVIAVIMIIFGGLKYITSGGESNKITSAKNTILYALIGLVVVALSQFIVRFVLAKTSGVVSGT